MKKTIFAILATIACAFGANAQENNGVYEVTIRDQVYTVDPADKSYKNWFVSAEAGPMAYYGDHNRQCRVSDVISPALNISVGKWLTDMWGLRLTYSGLYAKGATQGAHSTGKPIENKPWAGYWLYHQKFGFFNIHADVMLNLHNAFNGYDGKRFWNTMVWLGPGIGYVWSKPSATEVTVNGGWVNTLRLTNCLDAQIEVHAMIVRDEFSGDNGGRKLDTMLSITAGLNYRF